MNWKFVFKAVLLMTICCLNNGNIMATISPSTSASSLYESSTSTESVSTMEHSSTMLTSPVEESSVSSNPTTSETSAVKQTPSTTSHVSSSSSVLPSSSSILPLSSSVLPSSSSVKPPSSSVKPFSSSDSPSSSLVTSSSSSVSHLLYASSVGQAVTIAPSSAQPPMLSSTIQIPVVPTKAPGPTKFLFSFKIDNKVCTVNLRENNAQTVEYKNLAKQIIDGVNEAFKDDKTYTGSRLVRFDCGSVVPVVEVSKTVNATNAVNVELKPIADKIQTGAFIGLTVSSFDSTPSSAALPRLYIKLGTELSNDQFCRHKENFRLKLASFIVTSNGFSLIQPSQIVVFGNKCTDTSQRYQSAVIHFYVSTSAFNAMDIDSELTTRTYKLVKQFIEEATTWRLSAAFDKRVNKVEMAGADKVDETALSEMTIVLIGMGATFGLLLLIVLIIVIVSLRKRKSRDEGRYNAVVIGNEAYMGEDERRAQDNEGYHSTQINVDDHDYEYPDGAQSIAQPEKHSPAYEDLKPSSNEAQAHQQYQPLSAEEEAASKIQIEPEETAHYQQVEAIFKEGSTNLISSELAQHKNDQDLLKQEFQHLDYDMPASNIYPLQWTEKNRVGNVIPRPETRVVLGGDSVGIGGYINANYIRDSQSARKVIITQAPLQKTAEDFWKMVIEQNVHAIVMVVPLVQEGMEKCFQYWPPDSMARTYGVVEVQLSKKELKPDFTVTTMIVKSQGELREVCLYRYMTWPENNIPENVNSFVRFVLEAIKGLKTRESSKLVVHCSDGIGMSAVLVAIVNGIESLAERGSVDVYNIVKVLRKDRAGAVEQFDQYRFIYEALQEYLVQMRDSQQEYINNSDITSSM